MKKGQVTEEEIFSNQEHSEAFDEFLNLLGNRVQLKDFNGYFFYFFYLLQTFYFNF